MTTQNESLFKRDGGGSNDGPVVCLGLSFADDNERRSHFTELLREKLRDPEFRAIHGFPIGQDDDILALSDPPYYTACPNPWLTDFVAQCVASQDPADDGYQREPFAVDVSEGKTDALYRAHAYHTKVPHRAIVPSILHYTRPGDIVLDGLCGSGMTGVAAQLCSDPPAEYRRDLEERWRRDGRETPEWGTRCTVLGDLSPAATSMAASFNLPFDRDRFLTAARELIDETEDELGWMYETQHTVGTAKGRIDYTVWSEVFSCPECGGDVVFVAEALDPDTRRVDKEIRCPHCSAMSSKEGMELQLETYYEAESGRIGRRPVRVPTLIAYVLGGRRFEKVPGPADLEMLKRIADMDYPSGMPITDLPDCQMTRVGRMRTTNTSSVRDMFLPRAAQVVAALWDKARMPDDRALQRALVFFVEQVVWTASVLNRYRPASSFGNAPLKGVFYVSSMIAEASVLSLAEGALRRVERGFRGYTPHSECIITTGDCAHMRIPKSTIDYIFTDPPFGENIYYADLNFLTEAWYRVFTNVESEAIIDRARGKALLEYQRLMKSCFEEYYRVLKPGRWMTVVFHNSRNAVWNAIQEALLAAGFVVADVRVLDKMQGSFRQLTSNAVKRDLVISAYKVTTACENRFRIEIETPDSAWAFVDNHLRQLPVTVAKDDVLEVVAERQPHLLYDRMVAFHVQRGAQVPLSAVEFYDRLEQRLPCRDGMYFMPEQVADYDRKRLQAQDVRQLELFVTDEASAIQWLRQTLSDRPVSFQDLHPLFMQEIAGWEKHEKALELAEMLEQNFVRYEGTGEVSSQIHAYLSSNFREMRGLDKNDEQLRMKAKDRWYVPDPRRAGDLEQLRERALLKEFDDYATGKGKLKLLRLESVRAGFKRAWQEHEYQTIIEVAERLPTDVLQEDAKLLMWYDQALTRTGE